jgi:transcriptional regulator with XRE-family HTH domain
VVDLIAGRQLITHIPILGVGMILGSLVAVTALGAIVTTPAAAHPVRQARLARGWSQRRLAARAQLNESILSGIESSRTVPYPAKPIASPVRWASRWTRCLRLERLPRRFVPCPSSRAQNPRARRFNTRQRTLRGRRPPRPANKAQRPPVREAAGEIFSHEVMHVQYTAKSSFPAGFPVLQRIPEIFARHALGPRLSTIVLAGRSHPSP